MMEDISNIELRSERTRHIITTIPSGFVRYGTLIIAIIVFILLAVSFFVPYPESLEANIVVVDTECGLKANAYIPYSYVNTIKENMNAVIEFDGYPSFKFGCVKATVTNINRRPHVIDGLNYFVVSVEIKENNGFILFPGMKGTTYILISNNSLLREILSIR